MPEGHHPPLSQSSNVEHPRIVGLPLRSEDHHRSPLHPPSWSWRYRPGIPGPGEAGRPGYDRGSGILFSLERPCEGAAGGWRGVDPSCGARTRSAWSPRAFTRRMSPPRRGKGGRWSADRALFRRNCCRGRAWRGCSAFSGPPPCTAYPLKTCRLEAKPPGRPLPGRAGRPFRCPPNGPTGSA